MIIVAIILIMIIAFLDYGIVTGSAILNNRWEEPEEEDENI